VKASDSRTRRLTIANGLTLLRGLAGPVFFASLLVESWGIACLLFWLAVASDFTDGRLARARGESSAFGGLLDHASDATFVSLGLAALAIAGRAPLVLPLLVLLAFVQYVLDSRALAGRRLRSSFLGRWNGILYFVPTGIVTTRQALGLSWPSDVLVGALGWMLVLSTLVSMVDRAWTFAASRRRTPLPGRGAPPG
jgi:phosphatidylglycerophosphate synthase